MKNPMLFIVFILWVCSTTIVIGTGYSGTPGLSESSSSPYPRLHELNLKLKNQWRKIEVNLKSGKITEQKALNLRAGLESILEREAAFFAQNGEHDLTVDQQNQLNQMLDKNIRSFGGLDPP